VVVVVPMTELISTAAAAALDGEMNDRAAGGRNAPHCRNNKAVERRGFILNNTIMQQKEMRELCYGYY
jgi:hypothetical protein